MQLKIKEDQRAAGFFPCTQLGTRGVCYCEVWCTSEVRLAEHTKAAVHEFRRLQPTTMDRFREVMADRGASSASAAVAVPSLVSSAPVGSMNSRRLVPDEPTNSPHRARCTRRSQRRGS